MGVRRQEGFISTQYSTAIHRNIFLLPFQVSEQIEDELLSVVLMKEGRKVIQRLLSFALECFQSFQDTCSGVKSLSLTETRSLTCSGLGCLRNSRWRSCSVFSKQLLLSRVSPKGSATFATQPLRLTSPFAFGSGGNSATTQIGW